MVHSKMKELQELGISWAEVQFMKKAVDILCLCRQTLMYTYVFAYYLKKNHHMTILEVSHMMITWFEYLGHFMWSVGVNSDIIIIIIV